jgi:hypothetical protein
VSIDKTTRLPGSGGAAARTRKGAGTITLRAWMLVALATGCSKIVGFGDVTLADPGTHDAADDARPIDAAIDAAIDAPNPKLWVFVTDASTAGGFGVPNGARTTADIRCMDMYTATFTNRACTQVHAVIQIDDVDDSLARMKIKFPIPTTSQVQRATDETPVAANWDELVNPNASLSAPVVASAAAVPFWSGRGIAGNIQCSNWTSASSGLSGNAGDATKVNAWMSQANFTCNNFNQRLLCTCW